MKKIIKRKISIIKENKRKSKIEELKKSEK